MDTQIKSENDRLKLALAQSSNNARKWEEELKQLKSTNARLTTALQESHSNVEEWKTQLKFYTEECSRLRAALEANDVSSIVVHHTTLKVVYVVSK
jgi:homer protein